MVQILPLCPTCSVPVERSHRRGALELYGLTLVPYVRPFRCPRCGRRSLRLVRRPPLRGVLLLLLSILLGVLLVQAIWTVGIRAHRYPGGGYEPKDMERQMYLDKQRKVRKAPPQ